MCFHEATAVAAAIAGRRLRGFPAIAKPPGSEIGSGAATLFTAAAAAAAAPPSFAAAAGVVFFSSSW